jgi:hypothetical protein
VIIRPVWNNYKTKLFFLFDPTPTYTAESLGEEQGSTILIGTQFRNGQV